MAPTGSGVALYPEDDCGCMVSVALVFTKTPNLAVRPVAILLYKMSLYWQQRSLNLIWIL